MGELERTGSGRPLSPIPERGPAHQHRAAAAIGPITEDDWRWLLLASLAVLSAFILIVVGGSNAVNVQANGGAAPPATASAHAARFSQKPLSRCAGKSAMGRQEHERP